MSAQVEMHQIGEKTLKIATLPGMLAYCPSMELLAVATITGEVLVHRVNGQRVHAINQKGSPVKVDQITWKPNGQLLASSCHSGLIRLTDTESGKTVHETSIPASVGARITCTSWSTNLTAKLEHTDSRKRYFESLQDDREMPRRSNKSIPSRPEDLALIDIDSSLPKLSILPSGDSTEDIFNSSSSLDGLFRPYNPQTSDTVDVMVVGTDDGQLHLSIYDSFAIGSFPSPLISEHKDTKSFLTVHAAHPLISTHWLLLSSRSVTQTGLFMVPMNLRFISATGSHLSLLASKSSTLHNLLRYIRQVLALMAAGWNLTRDLPGRFLSNIDETLRESSGPTIVQAMYHSIATGHTIPAVKEWLVDELAERGHKRWDKAVTGGLDTLRRLIHEHMLPALERCASILSRFAGIARYRAATETVGFSTHQIRLIMDTISSLHLASTKILCYCVDEIDLFSTFSSWLRIEIDRLASSSTSSEDQLEKESGIDHMKVMLYIQTAMMNSPLAAFFHESSEDASSKRLDHSVPILESLDKELQRQESGVDFDTSMLNIEMMVSRLEVQCTTVFRGIADAEKRNVLFGQCFQVYDSQTCSAIDMVICAKDAPHYCVYLAIVDSQSKDSIFIRRISSRVENGISTNPHVTSVQCALGEGTIEDLAFLDEQSLLILQRSDNKSHLKHLIYNGQRSTIKYGVSIQPQTVPTTTISLPTDDPSFLPAKIRLRKPNKNPSASTRVCLVGQNSTQYKIIDLSIPVFDSSSIDSEMDTS